MRWMTRKRLWTIGLILLLAGISWLGIAALARQNVALWPVRPGRSLKTNGKLQVDANQISEGYFQACVSKKTSKRLKLRVKMGNQMLTYDLNSTGNFEVFPLQLGNGNYTIELYENVSGKKYSQAGKVSLNVKLSNKNKCFLYPNQYVNYGPKTEAVTVTEKLIQGTTDQEIFDEVCGYMKKTFVYDFIKASKIKNETGVLPDIDDSWKKKRGVCQDLSAIMCAMLRSQGIPARLMIGYADKSYHAWVVAVFDGKEHFFDPTAALNGISKVKQYTVERYY